MTGLLELAKENRGAVINPLDSVRAYDNCGRFLLGFSSTAEKFQKVSRLNSYSDEDLAIGGYGSATIGKVFSIGGKGKSLYYVAGQAERSYYKNGLYLFGQLTGASSFAQAGGQFTYQEFLGLGFYQLSDEALVAVRFREQATWNWYAKRQLILDSDFGLRGFAPNSFVGDNRMLANVEMRIFPDWKIWIVRLSAVAFYDGGNVWNQATDIMKSRWYNSVGLGFRLHDMKTNGARGVFRVDFAYNATDKKFGGIVFTTSQLFSVFQNHPFRLPELFGMGFDNE
jgi:hemolysin activation/secretion protein